VRSKAAGTSTDIPQTARRHGIGFSYVAALEVVPILKWQPVKPDGSKANEVTGLPHDGAVLAKEIVN
jgi:hypothetical protein